MGKIIQLSNELSNKIAAGEVVERPASVVKELVENAIDANSKHIRIDIEEGGLNLIRILDDGDGIEEEDVETAFFRHATSKIRDTGDLFRIATLGFRGEALPSIASVSKLTLKTSSGEGKGHEITLEGGRITARGASPTRKGTEIIVSDLFYNTPARLKYLRTIHTELGHISDVVNRMALAHPEIAFALTHNGKTLMKTAGNGDLLRVITAIYGSSVGRMMLPIEAESLDFAVTGYIAKPEVYRSNRSYMSTIINGRYIRNYPLMRAIQEGYHTLLPIGKHPIVILHINMDPILIDVNVHPSKLEVRLSKEQALQELVTSEIKKVFQRTRFIPEVKREKKEKVKSEQLPFLLEHDINQEKVGSVKETSTIPASRLSYGKITESDEYGKVNLASQFEAENSSIHEEKEDKKVQETNTVQTYFKEEAIAPEMEEKRELTPTITQKEKVPPSEKELPVIYPIGQLHGTYILGQNDQGLFIIDQHAAQERIKYEYFREKVKEIEPALQDLLVPLTFELTQAEEERVKERGHLLSDIGISLEPFGTRTYLVRSHPTWFPKGQEKELIEEMLEQIKEKDSIDIGKLREEAAILMSCKAAIKANKYLTKDEMFRLLETLRTCEEPYTCPHGRPVVIHYSSYEMEKMFKRIM